MWFTVFCCISTALSLYCVLKRVNRRTVELAVQLAVHEAKKEFQGRNAAMASQLASKEEELVKARKLAQLHEAVPTRRVPAAAATAAAAAAAVAVAAKVAASKFPAAKRAVPAGRAAPTATGAEEKPSHETFDVFAMSRPFTDTSYDALMAVSDVVRVEPAAM